jgi:tight adherence protein B
MMSTTLPPAITATAILAWPTTTSTHRLRALVTRSQPQSETHPRRPNWRRPAPAVLIGTLTLLALLTSGIGTAIAVAVASTTIRLQWRARTQLRHHLTTAESMSHAIHGMVAELRAGAHPVAAAESAAQDATAPADTILTAIASTARLGGDLTSVLTRFTTDNPTLRPSLRPLIHAWSLAQRHGLPLAEVLDAVRTDVANRLRFAHKVKAHMAGPKASGTVLAALPLLGVLLGETMGANPLHILLANPLGQALLALGTTLICTGLYWINRLTTRAALS